MNTDDLDASVTGGDRVREIAREIGIEHGIREDWLSGASEPYIPFPAESDHEEQIGSVTIRTASDGVLLAMKLVADREKDTQDIRRLIRRLGIRSAEDLVRLAKDVYGEEFLEFGLNALGVVESAAQWHNQNAWTEPMTPARGGRAIIKKMEG